MSYREKVEEIDLSGFATQSNSQTGGIVVKAKKGDKKPKLCQGETQVITRFGKPSPEVFGVFEAIEYARVAPVWIVRALGQNYRYAGVDVRTTEVVSFGSRSGRVYETFSDNSYSSVQVNTQYTVAVSGDGLTSAYSGTITPPSVLPVIASTVQLKVGSNVVGVTVDVGTNTVTSDAFNGSGTFNISTGSYSINFNGTVGTVASYTSEVAIVTTIDLSANSTDKKVNLEIDGTLYQNVNFGSVSGTTKVDIINVINSAVGYTAATIVGNYIKISGKIASYNIGSVKITAPSSGDSALNLIFKTDVTSITSKNSVSPTGYIPKVGEKIEWDFNYLQDVKTDTSFSLFMSSPFNDSFESYSIKCKRVSGKRYSAVLYQNTTFGQSEVKTYEFSLIREKNNFGKSLYYTDVFKDDDYLKIYVNSSYTNIADPNEAVVLVTGGNEGDEPLTSDYVEAWTNFQKKNVYKVKTFMEPYSTQISTVRNIINNYQPYAFGICVVPLGSDVLAAKSFRQSLGIDFDGMALYTNWSKIEDPYNNSFSWTSNVGKIGVKYSQMNDVFDGLVPAGIDENGRGGQLNTGFKIVELEYDYSDGDGGDLQILDENQLNPIVFDQAYGPMIYGNKTLQVSNSDTSYINHRRLYNYMIEQISVQILKKQVFKLNDELHRLLAKTQTETFMAPIDALDLVREFYVQCDDGNNNDSVLQVRKFILDLYVKITPDSEFVLLRLTRLPQSAVIADFIVQ